MSTFTQEELSDILTKAGFLLYDYNIAEGVVKSLGAVEEITGFTQEEFEQTDIVKWTERMHPEDRENAHDTQMKFLLEGGAYDGYYRVMQKDGTYVKVHDKGFAFDNEEVTNTPQRMTGLISIHKPE